MRPCSSVSATWPPVVPPCTGLENRGFGEDTQPAVLGGSHAGSLVCGNKDKLRSLSRAEAATQATALWGTCRAWLRQELCLTAPRHPWWWQDRGCRGSCEVSDGLERSCVRLLTNGVDPREQKSNQETLPELLLEKPFRFPWKSLSLVQRTRKPRALATWRTPSLVLD